ncbi:hypothetical protein MMC27_004901 [Xylographa pallens]|nr:hypothetical protein [Xylographa pallens]
MSLLLQTEKEEKMEDPPNSSNLRLFNDWATLVVGPEKKVFKMHKGLLCSVSPYFKAALKGDFKEAQEQVIELTEYDSQTMEYFQFWLYTQSILDKEETVSNIGWHVLVELYILGEVRLIAILQNQVIDLVIRKAIKDNNFPPSRTIYDIFDKTCPESPLRKFIVYASARNGCLDEWEWAFTDEGAIAQRDFLKDLVVEMYSDRKAKQERDFWKIRCDYHVHTEREARCSEDTPNPDKLLPTD